MRRQHCSRKRTSNSTEDYEGASTTAGVTFEMEHAGTGSSITSSAKNMRFILAIIVFLLITPLIAHESTSGTLSPPYTCTTTTTLCQPGESIEHPVATSSSSIKQGRDGKRGIKGIQGAKGEKGDPCECEVADQEEVFQLRREWQEMQNQYLEMKDKFDNISELVLNFPENCEEYRTIQMRLGKEPNKANVTIYPLKSVGDITSVVADCSSDIDGGWIVIQRRMDGSVDFYRGWTSYANGFGISTGEFWMGLKLLHKLTSSRNYKLRIEIRNWEGESRYAEYSTFQVGKEALKFPLTISGYSGTAGDSMATHNGMKFSTFDSDNDNYGLNCALKYHGAWWYNGCHYSNLNGEYKRTSASPNQRGLIWYHWMGYGFSLPYVEMKIKEM